jgi:hypothetical protein
LGKCEWTESNEKENGKKLFHGMGLYTVKLSKSPLTQTHLENILYIQGKGL